MTDYLLLSQLKGTINTNVNAKDPRLSDIIREESGFLDRLTRRHFDHRAQTRYFCALPIEAHGDVDGDELVLDDDLISVSQVAINGVPLTNGAYTLLPINSSPKTRIALNPYASLRWIERDGVTDPRMAIAVTGIWGYGGEWRRVTTLTGNHNDETTELALASVEEIEHRQILRVDDEYMLVNASVTESPVTVERGVNGSTPDEHSIGAGVYRFVPLGEASATLQRACELRLEQGKSPLFGLMSVGDFQTVVNTGLYPPDLIAKIELLTRRIRIIAG